MQKHILTLILALVMGVGSAWAADYDFSAVCSTGQTLYYKITNSSTHEVQLTYPNYYDANNYWNGYQKPTGDIVLPEMVEYESVTYSVTSIRDHAFYKCSAMTGSLTIPNSVTSIGDEAFCYCSGFTGSLTIGNSVTSIGDLAFYDCIKLMVVINLSSLDIVKGATTHGYAAYYAVSVKMSGSTGELAEYGDFVFFIVDGVNYLVGYNGNDTQLTLPNSYNGENYEIGSCAFYGCSGFTGSLVIPNFVTEIGNLAFRNCSGFTGSLTIPNSVTSIGDGAFANCSGFTGSLVIPNSVTSIGEYAFDYCSGFTGSLTIPNSVTSIGEYAFYGCSGFTGSLTIGNSVTEIGRYAFRNCSGFTGSLVIPNSVTSIGSFAFFRCCGFTGSLVIPNSVTWIGVAAFYGCRDFTSVISENPMPPTADPSSFVEMTYTIPLYVPYGTMSSYQNAEGWSLFTNRVEQCVFDAVGMSNENWSNEECWYAFELPGANDVVCINSNCQMDIDANVLHTYVYNLNDVLTIKSGKTLTTPLGLGILQPSQLVMEEGSQIVNNVPGVHGTVQRQIGGYTSDNDGWYTIAAPIYGGMPVSNLTLGNYDLFAYDEPNHYWRNVKNEDNDFSQLNPAQGYLYANQANRTVALTGQFNASNAQISMPVTCIGDPLEGFNLVGNPYTNNISIGDVKINGVAQTAFYRAEGGNLVAYVASDNEPIKPGDGFFVKATENGTLTFGDTRSRGERQQDDNYVRLVLNKDGKVADRAYLRMNQGTAYEKLSMGAAHNQLYFKDNGQSYAIANRETESSMVPLFLENANGTYTIEATQLNAQCEYLHLIDNLTGADIDLLETPTYTFDSKPSNYASRFKLVFSEDQENASIDSESNFAYISNGELVISNEGQATLQVIDVLGRVLVSQTIDGECRFSTESMTKGLYILNLNGMTQKIVVE